MGKMLADTTPITLFLLFSPSFSYCENALAAKNRSFLLYVHISRPLVVSDNHVKEAVNVTSLFSPFCYSRQP